MKKNLKKAASFTLATVMALSLAGCGGSGETKETTAAPAGTTAAEAKEESKADAQEPVTIKFSWWGGDSRHEATEKAVAAFMEKYPYITVGCMERLGREAGSGNPGRQCCRCNADQLELDHLLQWKRN